MILPFIHVEIEPRSVSDGCCVFRPICWRPLLCDSAISLTAREANHMFHYARIGTHVAQMVKMESWAQILLGVVGTICSCRVGAWVCQRCAKRAAELIRLDVAGRAEGGKALFRMSPWETQRFCNNSVGWSGSGSRFIGSPEPAGGKQTFVASSPPLDLAVSAMHGRSHSGSKVFLPGRYGQSVLYFSLQGHYASTRFGITAIVANHLGESHRNPRIKI